MEEGTIIALAALGITIVIQAAGVAYFAGVITQKVTGLRKDVDEHKSLPAIQAHSDRRAQ